MNDHDEVPMVTRIQPGKEMPSLRDLQGAPWGRLLVSGTILGIGLSFVLTPILEMMIFGWNYLFGAASVFVGFIISLPFLLVTGYIWKRIDEREKYEGVLAVLALSVCVIMAAISINFWLGRL